MASIEAAIEVESPPIVDTPPQSLRQVRAALTTRGKDGRSGGNGGRRLFAAGSGFFWSYVLLGVSTAIAIYLGLAVAESLRGGGGDAGDLPLGSSALRAIPCASGPFPLANGASQVIEFDPAALKGFEMKSVSVKAESGQAQNALIASVQGKSTLHLQAARISSATARTDQFLVQIGWQREGEDALSDCTVLVAITPSPTATP
jgi:hypothetical protein